MSRDRRQKGMNTFAQAVRLPSGDESIAPVTILDAQRRVVRVVPAEQFRRARSAATTATFDDQRPGVFIRANRRQRHTRRETRLASAAARPSQRALAS